MSINWKELRYLVYGFVVGLTAMVAVATNLEPRPNPTPEPLVPSAERMGACCREGQDGKVCFTMTQKRCDSFNDSSWMGYVVCSPEVCR